jgi:hypothetical protein
MRVRAVLICSAGAALMANSGVATRAQTASGPTAYTITVNNSMFGPTMIMKTYRLGSKAVVDTRSAPDAMGAKAIHTRTLYDLQGMESLSWDPEGTSAECNKSTFSGDWGDPFAGAEELTEGTKQVGVETIHGIAAKVLEGSIGTDRVKVWLDGKTGLVLKAQMTPVSGSPRTAIEVTEVSFTRPPASVFDIPANCAAAAAAARTPTQAERIAAVTGGNAGDFANGIYGPGSKNSCTMLFRVVHAHTMEPIASRFHVAIDLKLDTEPTPSYQIAVGAEGPATFSGGGLHEISPQTPNGVFRIENVPAHFELVVGFGNGGPSAGIYRQCFAPQTVLLYVVDPSNLSGDSYFLWVKSGKYARVQQ